MAAAYAALASLMHIIHKIEHHHSPPISLDKEQAQSLTQNITFLQEFLESYNPSVFDDESADPLEMRIADAAYEAEDVIESHIVDTIHHLSNRINQTKQDEQIKCINFYINLQQVILEMDLVRMSLDTSGEEAASSVATSSSSSSSSFSSVASVASSSTGTNSSTTVVVGIQDASLQIMEKLTEDRPDLQVIPIVGMGGIGKTTLARNVYEQKFIKEHFYIFAWATISQQYNTRDILCDVYSQVTNTDMDKLSGISEADLGIKLHKYLFRRRFLIVMDDMWNIDAWIKIQSFFLNNQEGSRILVTTRLLELSSRLNKNYSHPVSFLDEASSWDLFSVTVFGEKNTCPCELKKVAKKIVNGCRGLPLSIVVVGGLLKKMDATKRCWELIGSNLTSVVNLENDKHCLRLLRLSYNHLPVHLKPCFLYIGVFEEDAEISVSTLVKLWISEGFLKPMKEESLENSAMRFIKDLVDRNLVLINKVGSTGNIKSCKIHDLVRDLCVKEGQKDGLYYVIGQRSPRCINSQRRFVIPSNASEREVLGGLRSMSNARSIICEIGDFPVCHNLRLLRTFHAYKTVYGGGKSYTLSFARQYVNLRHLVINGVNIKSSFLSSACLLWNLQTIIVSRTYYPPNTIPEIWKMPQLRHIEFVDDTLCLPDPPSVDDDVMIIMENLQVLKGVWNFKCCGEVVKRIPNIKKLRIRFTRIRGINVDEYCLIDNIKFLKKLESLSVDCRIEFGGFTYLHNLKFQDSLKRLSFEFNAIGEWKESMLRNMGSLRNLEKLSLKWGFFGTGRWEIFEGQFPRLKYLSLYYCSGLEHWTAAKEETSIFPCLEQIHLSYLKELKSIPCEIGNIATLQKIRITGCNKVAVMSAKEMVEEQMELQGDELPFRVEVNLVRMNKELQSLSGPNFKVR